MNRKAGAACPGEALPGPEDQTVHRTIAGIILRSRDEDLAAAEHIRRAQRNMGG